MENVVVNLDNFVAHYLTHEIKKLYLSYLYQLEDLVEEEYITPEKYKVLRKRILDAGNECARNCAEQLKQVKIV